MSSTYSGELVTSGTGEAQAIIDAALASAEPSVLDGDARFHSLVVPNGGRHVVVDLEDHLDKHRERPRRKTGTYTVHDAASFIAYLAKHALPETEVWADTQAARLVAVINAHTDINDAGDKEGPAGWGDHRLTLNLRATDAWKAWTTYDGKLLDQADFAEHIEDRAVDIVKPTAADVLELAQTFQATTGVTFESSKLLSSGQRQLTYKEETTAAAGKRGQLEIPKELSLGLTPFDGAPPYKVTARFRYRITQGHLQLGYKLERPEDVLRSAFTDVVTAIQAGIDAEVFNGVTA